MDDSLLDKLKALGIERGAQNIKPRPKDVSYPIEVVMDGEEIDTAFGRTFCVSEQLPPNLQYGRINFQENADLHILGYWSGRADLDGHSLEQIIFLDTETSGLAGGTGTFAFMIGLGYWNAEGFCLRQLFMRDPIDEPALLAYLDQILTPFDVVVTYNGKSFDIPLLNSRHILNAFTPPFSAFHHIDLLGLARRIWKNRLASRSLGSIESEILGVRRNEEEIPGWMVPEIYFEYLKSGDARPLAGVFYHNRMDILSLAGLFKYSALMLKDPLNSIAEEGLDLIAVARLFEELGFLSEALQYYEHSLTLGLPHNFFVQTLYRYAHIAKRQGDWSQAVDLWERAASENEIIACIEIAKYYEHIDQRLEQALNWTSKALENLAIYPMPHYMVEEFSKQLEHRKNRILRKLETGK